VNLSEQEKKSLLTAARQAIATRLSGAGGTYPAPTENLKQECGAFVSLHIGSELRGCIGYIAARKPLFETVQEMALCAAFEDPRFAPLETAEFDRVEIEISVLSPLRRIESADEIEVGVHGIYIRSGMRSGLLLPQVATGYGWDRETFLEQTCRKAGLPPAAWKRPDASIEIFSAIVFGEHA
jgi:AmmeMemoRadiSam system protein A